MHTFLSQTAEYALRAMAWIAGRSADQPILARDLSEGTQIPAQYLSKILRRLVLAGILVSRKGRGGGFVLARPAGEIRFRDVLAAVDAYPQEGRCAFGWGECEAGQPCPLHDAWRQMSESFRSWAQRTTFADLVEVPPARMKRKQAQSARRAGARWGPAPAPRGRARGVPTDRGNPHS